MKKNELAALNLLKIVKQDNYHSKTQAVWQEIFSECQSQLMIGKFKNGHEDNQLKEPELLCKDLTAENYEIGNLKSMALIVEAYNRQISDLNKSINENVSEMMKKFNESKSNSSLNLKRSQFIASYLKQINEQQCLHGQLSYELKKVLRNIQSFKFQKN